MSVFNNLTHATLCRARSLNIFSICGRRSSNPTTPPAYAIFHVGRVNATVRRCNAQSWQSRPAFNHDRLPDHLSGARPRRWAAVESSAQANEIAAHVLGKPLGTSRVLLSASPPSRSTGPVQRRTPGPQKQYDSDDCHHSCSPIQAHLLLNPVRGIPISVLCVLAGPPAPTEVKASNSRHAPPRTNLQRNSRTASSADARGQIGFAASVSVCPQSC